MLFMKAHPHVKTAKKSLFHSNRKLFFILSLQMSDKELITLSPLEIGEQEATKQNQSAIAPLSHEPLLGKISYTTDHYFGFLKTAFLVTIVSGLGNF